MVVNSHESLVAGADLLDEDVILGVDKRLDAAVRALDVQDRLTAQQANLFRGRDKRFRLLAADEFVAQCKFAYGILERALDVQLGDGFAAMTMAGL